MSDLISRQAVYDALDNIKIPRNASLNKWHQYYHQALTAVRKLPSVQPETNCSEFPNTSDFVSRKAVREMVATWAYDLMEQEDLNMALLPTAQPEVIHCKDCKHYRTTGEFGVPLHKEEYYCDEEQMELPEWWFCAGAERKQK